MNDRTRPVIKALGPALLDDYLGFFDTEAFADNPGWAFCYCMFHHAPHHCERWTNRTSEQNREAAIQRITRGELHGYLAYVDGRAVGWCNAGPRALMTTLEAGKDDPAERIGSIVCFLVAQPYRGQGIARMLLHAAIEGFRRQGMTYAEAYPRKVVATDADRHLGTMEMYHNAGFEPISTNGDGSCVMRLHLRTPAM